MNIRYRLRARAMVTYANITLKDCIRGAYRVRDFRIVRPDCISHARYEITGKVPAGASLDQIPKCCSPCSPKSSGSYSSATRRNTRLRSPRWKGRSETETHSGKHEKIREPPSDGTRSQADDDVPAPVTAPSATFAGYAELLSRFTVQPILEASEPAPHLSDAVKPIRTAGSPPVVRGNCDDELREWRMSSMAVNFVPVEKYLSTVYHPDRDYVDGRLEKRNVGEFDHANLQFAIARYIADHAEQFRVIVLTEMRVQVKPGSFRVADVCCVRRRPKNGKIITEPPVLVIEILSPRDTVPQTEDRIADYLDMGVPFVWLIDPRKLDRAWVYQPGQPRCEVRDRILNAAEIRVSLDELPEQKDFE